LIFSDSIENLAKSQNNRITEKGLPSKPLKS